MNDNNKGFCNGNYVVEPIIAIPIIIFIGIIGLVSYSFSSTCTWTEGVKLASILGLFSGAVTALGAALGLLFGIPKTSVNTNEDNLNKRINYEPNTNLEQISDWLSKIILGAGLTQLTKLPSFINSLTLQFEIYNSNLSQEITTSSLVYFLVTGFFLGYLWSAINLHDILTRMNSLVKIQEDQENKLENLVHDNESLSLIEKHLSSCEDSVDDDVLKKHIMNTSNVTAIEIFRKARRTRRRSWRDNPEMVKRTTPIFRYLIERSISLNIPLSHKNYAQYGYSLMRQTPQSTDDLSNSYKNLTKALESLEKCENFNYDNNKYKEIYKFNRCLCGIKLSELENKDDYNINIENDLYSIVSERIINMIYDNDNLKYFEKWAERNNKQLPQPITSN